MDRLEHVGGRIRLFRKHQNMTLEELAYLVHKSPSTLCKYERGQLNIDIVTLFEIASALDIDISQLTDYSSDKPKRSERSSSNFFGRYSRFYVYTSHNITGGKGLMKGMMDVTRRPGDTNEDNVVLFLAEENAADFNDPLFIYTGTMTCDDYYAYIDLKNASGMKDTMFILIKSPQWMRNSARGILLSVSNTYGCPSASMILFATEKQKVNEALMEDLRIDKDEIIQFAKQTNIITTL